MDEILEAAAGAEAKPASWESLPEGEYAIVELFGHTTLVGRIAEVERFGTKMLAIEPIFNGALLESIYHGGGALYGLTPCSREIAWARQPRHTFQIPASLRAVIPPTALPPPSQETPVEFEDDC